MLIKINKQPIHVVEPDEEERDFSWVYMCVSTIGFTLILSLMDYICYIFFGTHPIPIMHFITNLITKLL
jgi:hypothetical protein